MDQRDPKRLRQGRGHWRVPAVLLALLCVLPRGLDAQERRQEIRSAVRGRVVDEQDGKPISGVVLTLEGTDLLVVTNDRGDFRMEPVPPGRHVLVAAHVAYAVRTDSLEVPKGALLELTVSLSTEAIELEELVVVVRSPVLERRGFYGRQRQGYGGTFMDRSEIEDRNPESVTALFRNMPGLRVVYGGIYGARIFMNQRVRLLDGDLPGCEPQLWLDGIRSSMSTYDMMRAEEIEGIEVYTGGNAPGKFNDLCGTVLIWTRVPINR